jgi:hypothetical protein
MRSMSFSDFRLAGLVAMGAVVGSLGCGDSLGLPPPNFANVVDTTTLFALQGTPISSPSGYDMVSLSTISDNCSILPLTSTRWGAH